jgi:hypothetical protein
MNTEFTAGDRVRMSREWVNKMDKFLHPFVVTEKDKNKKGMVYKVRDKYDTSFGIGVKWDDGEYQNVDPSNLEVI